MTDIPELFGPYLGNPDNVCVYCKKKKPALWQCSSCCSDCYKEFEKARAKTK